MDDLRPHIRRTRVEAVAKLIAAGAPVAEARKLAARHTRKVWNVLLPELVAANPAQETRIRRVVRDALGEL